MTNDISQNSCPLRRIQNTHINPFELKKAIQQECVDKLIRPYDEIDILFTNGQTVTVVCAYSNPTTARFVFKDCFDPNVAVRFQGFTSYYESDLRRLVLIDIYPLMPKAWRELIKPRKIVEKINDELVEYEDRMWLPSATDMFGPSQVGYWEAFDDSFQLPIFKKARERVKERQGGGPEEYFLRTISNWISDDEFCVVGQCGTLFYGHTGYPPAGFAPGFDI